jgi:hypothetical protein
MRRTARPGVRRLRLDDSGGAQERAAERMATGVTAWRPGSLARSVAGLDRVGREPAPASVSTALAGSGRPLDATTRSDREHRLGQSFAQVRVHTGAAASRSARDVDALAYTAGRDVVLGSDAPGADTKRGRHLLAHELAHVVQGTPDVVRRYRRPTSMAFGELDTATLIEQSFDARTDKDTKPWIEQVTVQFTGTATDADGNTYWTGTATATYYGNTVKLADVAFTVAGGSAELGRTDAGSFTVTRIEGYGYNSGSFSGTVDRSRRETGDNWKYTKKDPVTGGRPANMSFAVFYNRGEALHAGPLDYSSHGCVHVGWAAIQQINYHSVVGLTKVKVSYPKGP